MHFNICFKLLSHVVICLQVCIQKLVKSMFFSIVLCIYMYIVDSAIMLTFLFCLIYLHLQWVCVWNRPSITGWCELNVRLIGNHLRESFQRLLSLSHSAAQRFNPASKSLFQGSVFTGRRMPVLLLGLLAETPQCLEVSLVVSGTRMKPDSSSVQTLMCWPPPWELRQVYSSEFGHM